MSRFIEAFRAGLQGQDIPQGETFVVAGKAVACQHCGHDRFIEGRAQLHTAGLTFLKLEWLNASAATLTCTNCGRLEWFVCDPKTSTET